MSKFNFFDLISNNLTLKNSIIYVFAESINKLIPFILLPVLTIYLTPESYGIIFTYNAYVAVLAVFIHLSLSGAVNVNFHQLSKENLKIYITNTLLILFFFTFCIFIFIFNFQEYLQQQMNLTFFWINIAVLNVFFQFFTIINLVLWQAEQNAKKYALYQFSFTILSTTFILICVAYLKLGWEGYLIGQLVSILIFSLLSIWLIFKRGYLNFQINFIYIKDALKFGIPLIPHSLSGWFKIGVDRFFLTSLLGSAATGIYALGYHLGMIVGIMTVAFNQAFSQYLYKKLANITGKDKIKLVKYTYLYFVLVLLLASLISYLSPWFIVNFINQRYLDSIEIIPWIAFGYVFQGMYFMVVNYIFFVKQTAALSFVTFTTGILHVILSYVFIKFYGIQGAAYATTLSFFITFILVWMLSNRVYPMPWFFWRDK